MSAARPVVASDITAFDVIGEDSSAEAGFVRHVALATTSVAGHPAGGSLPATHMRPPLLVVDGAAVHTHATVPLSAEEQRAVQRFVSDLDLEYAAAGVGRLTQHQYCIRPHTDSRRAPDGTTQLRRFSCVGFVVEAYRDAGLDPVATDDHSLPLVSLDTLLVAYPDMARVLNHPELRGRLANLAGSGPWPVLLPGHLFAALRADEGRIRSGPPYQPVVGDEYFPPRRPSAAATAPPAR